MATEYEPTSVLIQQLDPRAVIPQYAKAGDAGADLSILDDVRLWAGGIIACPTGIAIALPPGTVGLIHPRSGLAAKYGVTIINSPGTIDSGYRGEIMLLLVNHGQHEINLPAGTRAGQLVIQKVEQAVFHVVPQLPVSERGTDGLGSTGLSAHDYYAHVLDRPGDNTFNPGVER